VISEKLDFKRDERITEKLIKLKKIKIIIKKLN
jgi:hypothetical protein